MYNKHTAQSYVQSREAHNLDFGAQSSDTWRETFFILAIELNSMLILYIVRPSLHHSLAPKTSNL